jgi:hypothetical protein
MQRVEANEGIDLRPQRKEVIQVSEQVMDDLDDVDGDDSKPVARRGRPRKV